MKKCPTRIYWAKINCEKNSCSEFNAFIWKVCLKYRTKIDANMLNIVVLHSSSVSKNKMKRSYEFNFTIFNYHFFKILFDI